MRKRFLPDLVSARPALPVVKLHDGARAPVYATAQSAAMDFASPDWHAIEPGQSKLIGLGLSMRVPAGKAMLLFSRSGHAKLSVSLANSVGVVDPDYSGEVGVFLRNDGAETLFIEPGDRIAQGMIVDAPQYRPAWVGALPAVDSKRGNGGWGSTGKGRRP